MPATQKSNCTFWVKKAGEIIVKPDFLILDINFSYYFRKTYNS